MSDVALASCKTYLGTRIMAEGNSKTRARAEVPWSLLSRLGENIVAQVRNNNEQNRRKTAGDESIQDYAGKAHDSYL